MSSVLEFVLLVAGWANAWLMTTPDSSTPDILLSHAYGFGVDANQAGFARKQAFDHADSEYWKIQVWMHNDYRQWANWLNEVSWRSACWSALDNALNPSWRVSDRLWNLCMLYDLLGEEAYLSRRMPAPTPQYRVELLP